MGHYRVYKLDGATRRIMKGKNVEAASDRQALETAKQDPDCPICEVWTGAREVGTIEHDE